jgi:hypothetical protein
MAVIPAFVSSHSEASALSSETYGTQEREETILTHGALR